MLDAVTALIESVDDITVRPRLRKCLPFLWQAIATWDASAASGKLVIAAATPKAAVVLAAEGWPEIGATKLKTSDVALALSAAIESKGDEGDTVLTGLTVMLGKVGIAAQAQDAAQIIEDGMRPLVVALLERQPKSVALLVTTIALPLDADGATAH